MEKELKLLYLLLMEKAQFHKDFSDRMKSKDESLSREYIGRWAGLNEAAELIKDYLIEDKEIH